MLSIINDLNATWIILPYLGRIGSSERDYFSYQFDIRIQINYQINVNKNHANAITWLKFAVKAQTLTLTLNIHCNLARHPPTGHFFLGLFFIAIFHGHLSTSFSKNKQKKNEMFEPAVCRAILRHGLRRVATPTAKMDGTKKGMHIIFYFRWAEWFIVQRFRTIISSSTVIYIHIYV